MLYDNLGNTHSYYIIAYGFAPPPFPLLWNAESIRSGAYEDINMFLLKYN